jgi:hypothetical protein
MVPLAIPYSGQKLRVACIPGFHRESTRLTVYTRFQPHRYHDVMSSKSFLSSAAGSPVPARNG